MLGGFVDLDARHLLLDRRVKQLDAELRRLVARHSGAPLGIQVGAPTPDGR
jgi:hypothetical protein